MSWLTNELEKRVTRILNEPLGNRRARGVPATSGVALRAGGTELDATFLFADLRHSTYLASNYQNRTAAKIIQSFIFCAGRLIKANSGTITSFDGDRVMGVFVGSNKNTEAVQTGLQINWAVKNIVKPEATSHFASIGGSGFDISHGVGIDSGNVLTVRAGQRGSNDLVWVGRAPNVAAKLSDIADSLYSTYIHEDVRTGLANNLMYHQGTHVWEQQRPNLAGSPVIAYRSHYWLEP